MLSSSSYNLSNSTGNIIQESSNDSIGTANFTWTDLVNVSNSSFVDGNYTLVVFANDSFDNSAAEEVRFIVDKTEPGLFGFEKSPAIVYSNVSVVFYVNVTDENRNNSGVLIEGNWTGSLVNYTMSLESGDKFNYSVDSGNFSNQENVGYRFYALDLAGNVNVSSLFNFTVENLNISSVNITNPSNGTIIEAGNLTQFNATVTDPDGDSLTYSWDFGEGTSSSEQNPLKQFNSTGRFVVVLNASDGYGSFGSSNITVVVNDTRPPTISLDYFTEQHLSRDGENQTVSAVFFDYSGISNAMLSYNGTLQTRSCSSQTNTSWTCSWSWKNLTVGSYNFTINFTDNFTTTHTNSSNYNFNVTSCSDGERNGDESGVDCGGSCSACSSNDAGNGGDGGGSSGGGLTTSAAEGAIEETVEEPIEEIPDEEVIEEEPEDAYSTTVSTSDGSGSVKIDKEKIAVSEIIIKTKEDKEGIKVEVKYLAEKPTEVLELNDTYQYLEINVDLAEEDLEESIIKFKVPNDWISENGYGKIFLNTFSESEWEKLDTTLILEGSETNYYQAKIEHFSYFAITGERVKEEGNGLTGMMTGFWKGFESWDIKKKVLLGMGFLIIVLLVVYYKLRRLNSEKQGIVRKIYKKIRDFNLKDEKKQSSLEKERPNEMEMAKEENKES